MDRDLAEEQHRPPETPSRRRRFGPRFKRWVGRVHMYAGLVMLPWLMFFGFSGLLFNHPNIGERVEGSRVMADELEQLGGLRPWNAERASTALLGALNGHQALADRGLTLDQEFKPHFSGYTILQAPADDGRHLLILDIARARGVLAKRYKRPDDPSLHLPRVTVELPDYSIDDVEASVAELLESRGKQANGRLRAHPKIAPELRLRARDADGRLWNLTYDTGSGSVEGRQSDRFPALGMSKIFSMLHTAHHFPMGLGWRWAWALFEDLLGLTMVFWGVSGIIMWWQRRPSRKVGLIALTVTMGLAVCIAGGTLVELTHGDVLQALGPGE